MNATLTTEISRLTRRQKLNLADRLLADAGLHAKPPSVIGADDPGLLPELRRRLRDTRPDAWLSAAEFRAKTGLH